MISEIDVAVTTVAFSTDEYLVNRISTAGFRSVKFNDSGKRLESSDLNEMLLDVDAAIIGLDRIDFSVLKNSNRLRVISKYGVGLDNINLLDCEKFGVAVCVSSGVNKRSVAEQVLGCMLMLSRNLYVTSNQLKLGRWNKDGGAQVTGKTVGIIGLGNIGKEVVELLRPFKCQVLINDIVDQSKFCNEHQLISVTKDDLLRESDFVTIHAPLTDELRSYFDFDRLKTMKSSAYLINTARGELINQEDLKRALKENVIAGAAIDVFDNEPPDDMDFIGLPNLIATPHVGGNSREAVRSMGEAAIEQLISFYA